MFCVKIVDSGGNAYPQSPYTVEADARAEFASMKPGSRFVRAELWSGGVDPKTQFWTDDAIIDRRDTA